MDKGKAPMTPDYEKRLKQQQERRHPEVLLGGMRNNRNNQQPEAAPKSKPPPVEQKKRRTPLGRMPTNQHPGGSNEPDRGDPTRETLPGST